MSFLLLAWALSAAHTATEIVYGNQFTAAFTNLWAGLSLTISSSTTTALQRLFTNDLEWLSFHRLCFLLGYAFFLLALPLIFPYLWLSFRLPSVTEEKRALAERTLWRLDRMGYRMVLWALPLLTAGIITEALLLLEVNQLPSPEQLLSQKSETVLALTAWFLCGIYLHTRLFFGWKGLRSATLYLGGLLLLLAGHLSQAAFI